MAGRRGHGRRWRSRVWASLTNPVVDELRPYIEPRLDRIRDIEPGDGPDGGRCG